MPLPLGVEFPPESAEWTFFVAAAIILLGPLLAERIGLPGIVGVILGGLLVGPYALGWVEQEGIVESLGELGILMLMFLAGLELDLDEFEQNRRGAVTFGALTFTFPFVLGILLVVSFGYGAAAAVLYGSLWASHTLVSYPIVQEHGLLRDRAVGIAGGGTVMTDTLALAVLAVVAGAVASDERPTVLVLEVAIGLAVLAAFCALVLPRVTRWVFASVGQHRGARFLFVLVALTSAALVADRAGIEGIVGAFFAGLAINRLVPARSRLMEQIEFVGGVLLIPFFLLSTGMLVDPGKFMEGRVLLLAGLSLAIVFAGKWTAAFLSTSVLGLARPQGQLLFGLSLAQAAATLAAVTIGVDIGIFDADLLSATLVVVLVTVLASSLLTRRAARKIDPPSVQGERLAENVFVPVETSEDVHLVRLASRLAMAKGGNVLVGAVAVAPGERLEQARERARSAEKLASSVGAEASSVVRIDPSVPSALAAIAAEHEVSLMVVDWRGSSSVLDTVLGGKEVDLVALADVPVLAVLTERGDFDRVVLAFDRGDLEPWQAAERDLAVATGRVAVAAAHGRAVVLAPSHDAARAAATLLGEDTEVVVDHRPRRESVAAIVRERDLVLLPARAGASPVHRDAAALAALAAGCSVAVAARPHAAAGLVTGTSTLVGRRAT